MTTEVRQRQKRIKTNVTGPKRLDSYRKRRCKQESGATAKMTARCAL